MDEEYADPVKLIANIRDISRTRSDHNYIAQDIIENKYLHQLETLGQTYGSRATLKFGADDVYLTLDKCVEDRRLKAETKKIVRNWTVFVSLSHYPFDYTDSGPLLGNCYTFKATS